MCSVLTMRRKCVKRRVQVTWSYLLSPKNGSKFKSMSSFRKFENHQPRVKNNISGIQTSPCHTHTHTHQELCCIQLKSGTDTLPYHYTEHQISHQTRASRKAGESQLSHGHTLLNGLLCNKDALLRELRQGHPSSSIRTQGHLHLCWMLFQWALEIVGGKVLGG